MSNDRSRQTPLRFGLAIGLIVAPILIAAPIKNPASAATPSFG